MSFPPATDIRKIRVGMDITQAELAARSGVGQSTIAKIERGKISASYDTVVKLFETLEDMRNDIGKGQVASDVCSRELVAVQVKDTVSTASELMRTTGFSQLPVFNQDKPVGSISEKDILQLIRGGVPLETVNNTLVSEIMGSSFPVVPSTTPVSTIAGMVGSYNAVLVSERGTIIGLVSNADMLKLI